MFIFLRFLQETGDFVYTVSNYVVWWWISWLVPDVFMLYAGMETIGNLIPGKCCFWRDFFAILKGNSSFRWIFMSLSYKHCWNVVSKIKFSWEMGEFPWLYVLITIPHLSCPKKVVSVVYITNIWVEDFIGYSNRKLTCFQTRI